MVDWSKLPDLGAVALLTISVCVRCAAWADCGFWYLAHRLDHDRPPFRGFCVRFRARNLGQPCPFHRYFVPCCRRRALYLGSCSLSRANLQPVDVCRALGNLYALSWPSRHRPGGILGVDPGSSADRGVTPCHRAPFPAAGSGIRYAGQLFSSTWAFRFSWSSSSTGLPTA